jgi:uncharacterized protein
MSQPRHQPYGSKPPDFPDTPMRLLSVTGGHRVDLDAFSAMMQDVAASTGATWAHAFQPAGQAWLGPECPFDVIVLHDLPGLALKRGTPPIPIDPTDDVRRRLRALTDRGIGLVVLHHALAGWPTWDGWADALGGRFNYAPGTLHGVPTPCSGTCIDTFTVSPASKQSAQHPVCVGIEPFQLTDEPYHCFIDEAHVTPLLVSDADMSGERFISTFEHVLLGADEAPRCDALGTGSSLVAWANAVGRSPVVVIQPGDSAATFGHPMYRRLVANAVRWVSTLEAKDWAANHGDRLAL